MIYVLREYLGSDGFLVLFRRMLLFLCVLGLVEAVMRKTPLPIWRPSGDFIPEA